MSDTESTSIEGPITKSEILSFFLKMKNDKTPGSPESLNGILIELDNLANNSGLRINFTKTKMVWIGSKKISKDVFHHMRWKLTWNNTTFDLLGIKFSVNLHEMPELNYKSKLLEIEQTIKQWK